jgi:flagellar hook-associated protein 2
MSSVSAVNSLLSGTNNTTTPTINVGSLLAASSGESTPGIDVTAAVAAAIYADRAPERIWQADQTTLTGQTTSLAAIQTATTAVTTDLQALNSLTGPLSARTATSSNTAEVTATAAAGTVAGNHTVVVNSLATTGAWYSDLATSATATLPASSFTLTVGTGAPVTIAMGSGNAGDNLNDLASTINGDKLGVTATVVTDSTGSRLAIIANASGTAGNFSITSANYTGTSWSSPPIPAGDTLGANSFTLTVGANTTTISTTAGETYATLASDINGMNLGVTATATSNANGAGLSITSSTPFTISEPGFGFTQAAAGANADLTVDGVPISSATNTVTGAISGVTLTLLGASPGTQVNLTVASDAGQVSTTINQFVTDYNTAMGLLNAQFSVNSTTNADGSTTTAQGALATDPTAVSLQSTLEQALNYTNVPATGTTTVASLGDLGITMNTDGTLAVDTPTLNSALTANPADVQNFLEGTSLNGFANSMTNALNSFTDPANGAFTVDLKGLNATNTNLTSQINDYETNYIANQQTVLTAEFSKAEIALQRLPQEMQQIQAELGNNNNGSSNG